MKFTISRKDLAEELSAAAEFTNKKNIVSLPNAVLLKCEADTLTISTFGPDCHYQGRRHVEGGEDGSAFVSYRQLAKFVWAMPGGELDISSDNGKLTVEPVKDKTCQVSIPLLAFEVPNAQAVGKDAVSFNIPARALNKALMEVSPPTSTNITRIFPCGVHIEKQDRGIVLTAADGKRLSTTYVECAGVPDFKEAIIPTRVLLSARKVFTDEGVVTVTIGKTDIVLTDGEHLIRSALIGLTYPEWRRVIPQDQPYTVTVDAKMLKDAVTRVIRTTGSMSNRIDITIGSGKILLDCRDNDQAHAEIPCGFDGEETHIALNATFLKDALSVMEGQVVIGFSDGKSAVTFHPVESQTVHVIMPMLDLQVQNFHRKTTDNTLALTARKRERKDNMSETTSPTKVVIPCRIDFANIWEPKSINGSEGKYFVTCLIPKSDKATLAKIQKAVDVAKEDAKGKKWNGKIPANLKLPLRDGDIDRPDDENYVGHMFLTATSKEAPQIVDRKIQPILDPMECGSGDYCNVSVNFYGFNANGNRGVAARLGNIQKVKDRERLAGKATAASDFDEIEGEDEDVFGDDLPDYLK